MAVAIASVAVATRPGGLAELQTPRTVVLWIPIVIGYWIVVGLRASFVMPTELPAAWVFRVHSTLPSTSYWSGVRASMIAFAIGPAVLVNALVVLPLVGFNVAAVHGIFVCLAVIVAAQFASLLVDSVPFTRAYPPGHAKLRTRWPLYLLGMFTVAYLPVQHELRALHNSSGPAVADRNRLDRDSRPGGDRAPRGAPVAASTRLWSSETIQNRLTVLNLGQVETRSHPAM